MSRFDFTYSVRWNLLLLTAGSYLFILGANGLAVPHQLIAGGLYGTSMLVHYMLPQVPLAVAFFVLNLPLFALGWVKVSRRFLFYSLYSMIIMSAMAELITVEIEVHNQLYAALAAGMLCGAGSGLILRSLGSGGGLDILAIYLNQKYNLGVGRFYILFNGVLFLCSAAVLDLDLLIASMIMVAITSMVVDQFLSLFNQRKIVYVISQHSQDIARDVMDKLRIGSTFLQGKGAFSCKDCDVLMTVINNIQLKRLEEIVFTRDPNALFIAENTFHVIGSTFSRRKMY